MSTRTKELLLSLTTALLGTAALLAGVEYGIAWPSGIIFFLYISLFSFSALFIEDKLASSILAIIPAAFSVFFLPESLWTAIGVFLVIILNIWSKWEIRKVALSSPKPGTRNATRSGLPIILSGAALLISLFYYAAYRDVAITSLIPRGSFEALFPHLIRSAGFILPDSPPINPDGTIDQFLEAYAVKALENGGIPRRTVSDSQFEALISEERQLLSERLGITLNGDEPIRAVFYEVANRRAAAFLGTYVVYVPAVLSVGVFFALRTIFIPFQWLAMLAAHLMFLLAGRLHIIKEETATLTIKRYTL
ncbi:MAG: hypothetical protein HY471_03240 [Candidatus Sungbacteria bacterium]|nr:hypothetical protein [Candidatus Sungbacteria bacterium]